MKERKQQELILTEEQEKARRKAMLLLEHKDRTEKELRDRLRQAGFSPEICENAIEYVRSFGYINDVRYASVFILGRMNQKSKNKIMQELQQKGIDRETAVQAWKQMSELEMPDERRVLRSAVQKKYEPGARLDEKEMRRLYGFLARRGFQYEDIASVLSEMDIERKS